MWWLSFANVQFLGVVIIEREEFSEAYALAIALGLNPGGEMQAVPIPEAHRAVSRRHANKLLSKDDIQKLNAEIAASKA
jgi:hypothetical protein